jgi:hypothetical protein
MNRNDGFPGAERLDPRPNPLLLGALSCDLIKIREVTGARGLAIIYFRAVAQLGRAPGSGQSPGRFAHLI